MTENYDETDREAQEALRNIFWQVVRKGGTRESMLKEFDSVLSQIFQPQGGSENFTNLRSPGMHPAKIPAVPGNSGRNITGVSPASYTEYRGKPSGAGEAREQSVPEYGGLDISGEYSQSDPNKDNGETFVGNDTRHPAYGSGRRNIRGPGYEPYKEQRGVLGKGLEQWEKERGTEAGINPGTTPLLTDEDISGEGDAETEAELAERIVQERNKPTEPKAEFAPTTMPKETTRDTQGFRPGETRKRIHPSYRPQ